jgi:hypothetical protein
MQCITSDFISLQSEKCGNRRCRKTEESGVVEARMLQVPVCGNLVVLYLFFEQVAHFQFLLTPLLSILIPLKDFS